MANIFSNRVYRERDFNMETSTIILAFLGACNRLGQRALAYGSD